MGSSQSSETPLKKAPPKKPVYEETDSNGVHHEIFVMYHATSAENAKEILIDGFKPSKNGLLGPGIYLYRDFNKTLYLGEVCFKVLVYTGKTKKVKSGDSSWHDAYDTAYLPPSLEVRSASVWVPERPRQETCIKSPDHVRILGIAYGYSELNPTGISEWIFNKQMTYCAKMFKDPKYLTSGKMAEIAATVAKLILLTLSRILMNKARHMVTNQHVRNLEGTTDMLDAKEKAELKKMVKYLNYPTIGQCSAFAVLLALLLAVIWAWTALMDSSMVWSMIPFMMFAVFSTLTVKMGSSQSTGAVTKLPVYEETQVKLGSCPSTGAVTKIAVYEETQDSEDNLDSDVDENVCPHDLISEPLDHDGYVCDICEQQIIRRTQTYSCDICNFDQCINCTKYWSC